MLEIFILWNLEDPPSQGEEVAMGLEEEFSPSVDSPTLVTFVVPATPAPGPVSEKSQGLTVIENPITTGADVTSPCNVDLAHEGLRPASPSPLSSPLFEWLPAEDVLPLEPNVDPATVAAVNSRASEPLLVYTRRQRDQTIVENPSCQVHERTQTDVLD